MKVGIYRFLVASIVIALGLVGWVTLFGNEGWLNYLRLAQTETLMRQRIATLNDQNGHLSREIYRLKHDRDYLERVTRQQLEMGKRDELVFKFR